MSEQEQKIALVTGASDGIGKETARQLAQQGLQVLIGSRSLEKGQKVVEAFAAAGLSVGLVQLDVTDRESIEKAAQQVGEQYGRLDVLVNNAGIALDRTPLSEMSIEDFTLTFQTNVIGTFSVTKLFLPLIRKSSQGRIVIVSSRLASLLNMSDENSRYYSVVLPSYAASKAALNALTIHFARELKDSGIKVNAVEPGLTATRYVTLEGAQPVEVGAESSVKYALIGDDGPTGGFFDREGVHVW
ncbi:SDR family oxidoreductase [Aeoliella mucimassa]|uniref:3-oxoacyl-[acyl-carrier-protein] reductase FabG n=1 Tax=Aeoliella mucimassa TaxID=2527972 RepID=A0A518AHT1_9BACT|nr:SDR family oxidoreductase [Aeoliella mucimassa]QDU54280.1 3-oxoacyl-[acyl-carrier-protein] reductase FabG [Aeoliella mucimassa]